MNALVSVILPVHNGERFLRQAIVSVQEQSYRNWELIIINDGSTDRSGKIIEELLSV
jgi:glycosyltransferase involved in cell wall biosynthesis